MFQNVANNNGAMKFIEVANNGDLLELYTRSRQSSVTVAGGARVTMAHQHISLQTQKDVSCDEAQCTKAFVGNGVKIEFTAVSGDTAAITALLDRANEVVERLRLEYNADRGIQPPVSATFPKVV